MDGSNKTTYPKPLAQKLTSWPIPPKNKSRELTSAIRNGPSWLLCQVPQNHRDKVSGDDPKLAVGKHPKNLTGCEIFPGFDALALNS
jgi:hypothetical protein